MSTSVSDLPRRKPPTSRSKTKYSVTNGDLVKAINLCEEPKHRFRISIFVGLGIASVFSTVDLVEVLVIYWLDEWSIAASASMALLFQLLFIFTCLLCFFNFCNYNVLS